MKKLIAISIPCFNEEENIVPITEEIVKLFIKELSEYDFLIQFIDNNSTDRTKPNIRKMCTKYPDNVRAIFNAKNFPTTSAYYGLLKAEGDCIIAIPCDFQVPLDTIPKMVRAWENGAKIVCLIKVSSKENKIMWSIRQFYYKLANMFSNSEIISNFVGSGLFDKDAMSVFKKFNSPTSPLIQFIVDYGYDVVKIDYVQEKRKTGKSKNNFWSLLNIGISRFVNSSSIAPRIATICGVCLAIITALIGLYYLIMKLLYWHNFIAGMMPVLLGVFFIGSVQLVFIGLLGEYVMKANKILDNRPLVVERERINFKKKKINRTFPDGEFSLNKRPPG